MTLGWPPAGCYLWGNANIAAAGPAARPLGNHGAYMTRPTITCAEYRGGRRLLALKLQLEKEDLPAEERRLIEEEMAELERQLGMD